MKVVVLTLAALCTFILTAPAMVSAGPVNVNISLDAFLPAPPGVRVHVEAGRPYYIVNERRVYMERRDKHDNGRHRGHDKDHRGKKKGHGKKHKHD